MSTDPNSNKLKFREPGARDTVIKVSPQNIKKEEKQKDNSALFTRIRATLTNSDPAKWEKYGEELIVDNKYPKAYEKWEIAYCIDLPNGLLTFRSSQQVISEYFGGGYTLKPEGAKIFLVELRPRSWDPRTLIDPFFRSTLDKDKQFKTLADGAIAKELYELIEKTFANFKNQKSRSIADSIAELANNIIELSTSCDIHEWKRDESAEGKISYANVINGINIELVRSKRLDLFLYELTLYKEQIKSAIKDPALARDLFNLLEERVKTAALEALNDVLDDAGL